MNREMPRRDAPDRRVFISLEPKVDRPGRLGPAPLSIALAIVSRAGFEGRANPLCRGLKHLAPLLAALRINFLGPQVRKPAERFGEEPSLQAQPVSDRGARHTDGDRVSMPRKNDKPVARQTIFEEHLDLGPRGDLTGLHRRAHLGGEHEPEIDRNLDTRPFGLGLLLQKPVRQSEIPETFGIFRIGPAERLVQQVARGDPCGGGVAAAHGRIGVMAAKPAIRA